MRHETVTSAQNPKIRALLQLQEKSKVRREQGLFVVEGLRELRHCLEGGYCIRTVFVCDEILSQEVALDELLTAASPSSAPSRKPALFGDGGCTVVHIPAELYRKVAYREGTEGIIAEVECRSLTLADLDRLITAGGASGGLESPAEGHSPLIVVLEAVEKPGNLGAVLRSADAAGADAVIVCDPLTDLYNPNLIRASIGAFFTVPTVAASSAEVIPWLKAHGIQILTAQLQDSSLYYETDMLRPTAIVMGTESTGLTQPWRNAADAHIRIPMLGRLDSLNVSVSAAILLYEAVRQRRRGE